MGLFSGLAKAAKAVLKSPVARVAASVIPGAATAYTAYEIGSALLGGGEGEAAPAAGPPLPPAFGTGPPLPAMAGPMANLPAAPAPAGVPAAPTDVYYQPIEGQNVTKVFRCRKGYVMVYYPAGTTSKVCMLKTYARSMGLWKASPKPPISVRDWRALGRADSTIKKLMTIEKKAKRIANFKSPRRPASKRVDADYVIMEEGKGGVKVVSQGRTRK